jgi:hypothetical protein
MDCYTRVQVFTQKAGPFGPAFEVAILASDYSPSSQPSFSATFAKAFAELPLP